MRSNVRSVSVGSQALIALLVSWLMHGPVALAAPTPRLTSLVSSAGSSRIAVVVVSQDAKAAPLQGQLEGAAEDALTKAARFSIVSVQDAFNPDRAQKRSASLENAVARLKDGKQALDELDNVKATEAFTAAVDGLKAADLTRDFPALLDAWMNKAAGHATGGEIAPAKKEIEGILGVAPNTEFSSAFFPPELLKFADAQKKTASNAKGELLVRTEPSGARVWVDGSYRGLSPVTVAGLTATKHFVTATLGGFALAQEQVAPGEEVITFAPAELSAAWKKAVEDIKKDPEGKLRDQAAQVLGQAAKLDQVFLVLAKKSVAGEKLDLIGLRLETRDGHNDSFKEATVTPGDPESMASFFDALTGADAKRDGKDPVHHFKGPEPLEGKTIAGYSLLGLGGLGIASGIIFGSLALGQVDQFHRTPQTSTFKSAQFIRDGRTYALVSDISWGVGIVSALVGAGLLFWDKIFKPSPESEQDRRAKDARRLEADRKVAEDRRAAEDRAREDERQRESDRKKEEDRRKAGESKPEEKKPEPAPEPPPKKLTKKEQRELEKKQREEEAAAKKKEQEEAAAAKKKEQDDAAAKKDAAKKSEADAAAQKKAEQDSAKKADADAAAKKKADEEAAAKKKADDEAAAKKREEDDKRRKEEAEKKKKEDDKKRKEEDHDDLRNY